MEARIKTKILHHRFKIAVSIFFSDFYDLKSFESNEEVIVN
jgi:hypothetical protein